MTFGKVKALPNRTIYNLNGNKSKKPLTTEAKFVAHLGEMFLSGLFIMLAVGILHGSNVLSGTLDYWSAFALAFLFSTVLRFAHIKDDDK